MHFRVNVRVKVRHDFQRFEHLEAAWDERWHHFTKTMARSARLWVQ